MNKIKAVVFDMDGVIFDSEIKVIECWMDVAEKYHIEHIENACRQCLGMNKKATKLKFLSIYGEAFPYDEYKAEMSALFHERYSGGKLPIKPGAHELLAYLRSKKIKIALASSTRKSVVMPELTDAGLIQYFDEIVCGDMVKQSKPAPDIFLKAVNQLQVEPQYAYAIEDSFNGIRSAYRAGMHPIMVPDLLEPDEEILGLTEVVLPSLTKVMDWFMNLCEE